MGPVVEHTGQPKRELIEAWADPRIGSPVRDHVYRNALSIRAGRGIRATAAYQTGSVERVGHPAHQRQMQRCESTRRDGVWVSSRKCPSSRQR